MIADVRASYAHSHDVLLHDEILVLLMIADVRASYAHSHDVLLCNEILVLLMIADVRASYARSHDVLLRDEILVFVLMAAMFIGLLVIVNFTRNRGRRRLYMSLDEIPTLSMYSVS